MRLLGRRGPSLDPLTPAPRVADLPDPLLRDAGRYLGTVAGDQRVRARGLGPASAARISLSAAGVDVVRLAGSFRIPASALRSARDTMELAPLEVGPQGALVVRWQHGDQVLDSGFRLQLEPARASRAPGSAGGRTAAQRRHREWSRTIARMGRSQDG